MFYTASRLHTHLTTITVVDGNAASPQRCLDRQLRAGMLTWPCRFTVLEATGSARAQVRKGEVWETVTYVGPVMALRFTGDGVIQIEFHTNNPDPQGDLL